MWIFTPNGFLSIVEHSRISGLLVIRSRFVGHLEKIFGKGIKVWKDVGTDYEYRIVMPKKKASKVIANLVIGIDYENFKETLKDTQVDDDYKIRCYKVYDAVKGDIPICVGFRKKYFPVDYEKGIPPEWDNDEKWEEPPEWSCWKVWGLW